MKTRNVFIPVFALVLLTSCTAPETLPPDTTEADMAAVGQARQQLIDAMNTDDVDGIMAVLTDDHVTMPADGPTPQTLAELRSWHDRRVAEYTFNYEGRSSEIHINGDWAIDHHSSTTTLTAIENGSTVEVNTKGLWIWRREADGSWKLWLSIWNSDGPA